MARLLVTGFCSLPGPNRPGAQLQHVVDGLLRDHEVDVLTLRCPDQAHVERTGGARILRVPIPDGDRHSQIDAFRRALRRQVEGADYDIVHFRDGWSGLTVMELHDSHRYATVFDVTRAPMAEPVLTDLATATELERAEEACLRRADLILAPTEGARQYLAGFSPEENIHIVPPGVNIDAFDWEPASTSGPPIILYLGSLTPGRGVRVLLRAMYDVGLASDAILVLAGAASPEFRSSLERAIIDLELVGRIRFLGPVSRARVPSVIQRATVCVAPGAAELSPKPTALFPTKLLEYMACRRPVIAPRRGTVSAFMEDEKHGLLFEPGDPDDLAAQILRLLDSSELQERVASAGYQLVRKEHTAASSRRSLRTAYQWLARQEKWQDRLQPSDTSSQELDFDPTSEPGPTTSVGLSPSPTPTTPTPTQPVHTIAMKDTIPMKSVEAESGIVDEGTNEWEPQVLEEGPQLKTVITVPLDNSTVAGVVESTPPSDAGEGATQIVMRPEGLMEDEVGTDGKVD